MTRPGPSHPVVTAPAPDGDRYAGPWTNRVKPSLQASIGTSSLSVPADRDRLDDAEPAQRTGRQRPRLELGRGQQLCGASVGDHPVAPRHPGEPGGQVDRRPADVPEL